MGEKAGAEHKFQFYDSDKGTFLGRTGGSWAKITVFYIAYFAFLAGLFTASIQLMQSQLPEDKPKLNTRLNIPGLHFFPKFDMKNAGDKERLGNNEGITFMWDGQNGDLGYQYYIDSTKANFDAYAATPSTSGVADFDTNTLGDCSPTKDSTYGWGSGKPCIYFRINKVINWEPVGLFAPEPETFFAQPNNGLSKPMVRDATYVRCQAKNEDNEIIDSESTQLFKYWGGANDGGDGYFPKSFFPYLGKQTQPDYESPVVAVQVVGLEAAKRFKIECNAFAKNIIVDSKANLGSIKFEYQNGGEIVSEE